MRPLALVVCLLGCSPQAPEPLLVFASASASDVAQDLAESSGAATRVSPGATSVLSRQIDAGAPAAVALFVGDEWLSWLASRQRLEREPVEVARGRLVIVVPVADSAWSSLRPLARLERLALADPAHVPAGRFARDALQRADLWREVEPQVIVFADVRAALGSVASGQTDAAVVYETDARLSDRVRVAALVPDSLMAPIVYRCAVVAGSGQEGEARQFCNHALASGETWRLHGFAPRQRPLTGLQP